MAPHTAPPSPWPVFVPVGLAVVLVGLGVLSLALVGAGIVMTALALAGWYVDAGHEWRAAEAATDAVGAGGHPGAGPGGAHEDATSVGSGGAPHPGRRPFPTWLVGVYGVILLMGAAITFGGSAVDSTVAAIHAAAAATPAPGAGGGTEVVAKNLLFSTKQLAAPAGAAFDLSFENEDQLPHNVAIYKSKDDQTPLFRGDIVTGPTTVQYHVPALDAGTYEFRCDVHPGSMTGTLTVR